MDKEAFDEWRTRPDTKKALFPFISDVLENTEAALNSMATDGADTLLSDDKQKFTYARLLGFQDAFGQLFELIKDGQDED